VERKVTGNPTNPKKGHQGQEFDFNEKEKKASGKNKTTNRLVGKKKGM